MSRGARAALATGMAFVCFVPCVVPVWLGVPLMSQVGVRLSEQAQWHLLLAGFGLAACAAGWASAWLIFAAAPSPRRRAVAAILGLVFGALVFGYMALCSIYACVFLPFVAPIIWAACTVVVWLSDWMVDRMMARSKAR